MNCGVDLMHPAVAMDACMTIIRNTPNWPQLLAYGVGTVALVLFAITVTIMVIRRFI